MFFHVVIVIAIFLILIYFNLQSSGRYELNRYFFSFFKVLHDLIVALKIVTPNSETAPSLEENKENIRQMASADAVDNGNSDSKTTSTTEVPMEVEGSGETNTNESVTNSSDSFTNLEFRIFEKGPDHLGHRTGQFWQISGFFGFFLGVPFAPSLKY